VAEMLLTYADLATRLGISPEAARALCKRHRLPKTLGNDGKTLVRVDLSELAHRPLPGRSPAGHRADTTALKAEVERLKSEVERLQATATGHRADFERERDRADRLMSEALRTTAELMAAKESAARLEGELAVIRARSWWHRLTGR
jgi:hypothetical protein